ncbi:MAG: chemotaxis protein CheC [Gammaproteobacteria bacterium]|nr:chemotaxis protein CheC [Gammaproteobacteria bacterium]
MLMLTELQHDVISETLNIGMGHAASALNELVAEEVGLAVPRVSIVTREEAVEMLRDRASDQVSGVSQDFSAEFEQSDAVNGQAFLLFPRSDSLRVVNMLLGDSVPLEALTEMEQEALSEIGNIIINATMSSFSDLLGQEINTGLPVTQIGTCRSILHADDVDSDSDYILFSHVSFNLEQRAVNGYVVLLMDVQSMSALKAGINCYLERLNVPNSGTY